MTYLYGYLGIGAVLLAIIFIAHRLTKSRNEEQIADLINAFDPRRDRWWWKPLNNVVIPMLAAVMVVVVWPIAIYWKAKEMIDIRQPEIEKPPRKFAVAKEHLQKQWTLAEIEAAEVVLDPLGAAPRTPFGHLNPAWQTFRQSILEDDQLWSFSAPWETDWGRKEIRDGYVVVRGEAIGAHFLTRWVSLDNQTEQP
jgi:hypothetical protein